jgi:cytochrome c551/c552
MAKLMPEYRLSSLLPAICLATVPVFAAPATTSPATATVVNQYCVFCHNQKLKTAGVTLDNLDPAKVGANAEVWEKVLRKVSTGQMPPAGMPHPKPDVVKSFDEWLTAELDHGASAHPNPGRPTIHRLNRAEYSNAVRDLLALDIKPGAKLPTDDSGYGFDNIGDVLSLSPVIIDRYMSVARLVSRLAVGDTKIKPEEDVFEPAKTRRAQPRVSDALPFDSSGGLAISYHFPVDAEYVFKIKMPAGGAFDGTQPLPQTFELKLPIKAGTRTVGLTFLAEGAVPEVVTLLTGPGGAAAAAAAGNGGRGGGRGGPGLMSKMDLRLDGARVKVYDVPARGGNPTFTSLAISGPYNVTEAGNTPSREKVFVCSPASAKDEEPCARKILTGLTHRAYRRPVTEADITPLLAIYRSGRKDGDFETGVEMALRAVLVSPDFLFRVERDPAASQPGAVHRVSDVELASRLSFFLWSSIPDEELLGLAEKNKLSEPAVLSAQVSRLLADPRSKAFTENFAGQWLYLRNLEQAKPDQDVFPEFDPTLRQAFDKETLLFFQAIVRENRPVTELLSANFTYLNQRLAEHYGIPGVYGSQFRRVTLNDADRGGLLGQGSILTVTSYPNRTSVVQRGKWVLENLLGSPPPPPPPDIPTLESHQKEGVKLTMRQQMEQHRANPTCASCHSRMDPIGFSLENYDGDGKWRSKDAGAVIDASGKMPDGATFQGPAGLKDLLLTKHRDEFIDTFTEKLLTYALGRGVEYYDRPAMRVIIRDAASQNTTIPALIQSIVKSPQFQMRRTRES